MAEKLRPIPNFPSATACCRPTLRGTVTAGSCTKTAGGDLTVGHGAKRKTAGRKRRGAGKVKFLTVLPAADIKAIKLRAIERGGA